LRFFQYPLTAARKLFRARDMATQGLFAGRPGSAPENSVRRLATIIGHGGRGLALARELAREGVRTRTDLQRPAILARLSRESQVNVIFSPVRNIPLSTAQSIAAEIKKRLVFNLNGRPRRFEVFSVGSVRRQAPHVKDIDFLVVIPAGDEAEFERVLGSAALRPSRGADTLMVADTYAAGPRRRSFILRRRTGGRAQNYRTDLFITTTAEKPYALYHFTGPKEFNIRTRAHVKQKGWLLNQYGLFSVATGRRIPGSQVRTERALSEFIGVTHRSPAQRE